GRVCFFQGEDGIRDWSVTGVQTCALPISPATASSRRAPASTSATIAPSALATLNGPGSVTDASASTPPGPITRNAEPSDPERTSDRKSVVEERVENDG